MFFFRSAKFVANKMRIKCRCSNQNLSRLPPECRFYDSEHQPRHEKCYHDIKALRAKKGVEDVSVISRNNILQTGIHTDADKCQREEKGRKRLCYRCFGKSLCLPIGKDVVALQKAERQRRDDKAKYKFWKLLPHKM